MMTEINDDIIDTMIANIGGLTEFNKYQAEFNKGQLDVNKTLIEKIDKLILEIEKLKSKE